MYRFLILNGPNLNFLGRRDSTTYGIQTLDEITEKLKATAAKLGVEVAFYQSNSEGQLIDYIQESWGHIQGIVINPGALANYGYSLKDALIDAAIPIVEVHMSNISSREPWRRHSIISDVTRGQITGFGWRSYIAALETITALVSDTEVQ
jgi:3-dehydroquinate dehydratase-2